MGFSMFDWPAQTQTSPTATLPIVRWSPTVMLCGPPASIRGRVTVQRPFTSATVLNSRPSNVTFTWRPGPAQPQIGIGMPRCSTM